MKPPFTRPHSGSILTFCGFWFLVSFLLASATMGSAWAQVTGGTTGWGWCPICRADFPNVEQHMLMHRQDENRPQGGGGRSAEDQYGVVTIYNRTAETVACQIQTRRWGGWQRTTIQPGGYHYHWQSIPAAFKIRFSNGAFGGKTWNLDFYTVTGRVPTAEDGRPYFISGTGKELSVSGGVGDGAVARVKPKLTTTTCLCGGESCRCLWDSCGREGARKCGCGGKDCVCQGKRCPKFASTTQCTGSTLWDSDGRQHCNLSQGSAAQAGASSLAGTWTGTIKLGITATFSGSLKVSADGSSVVETGARSSVSHTATRNGSVLLWRSGLFNEISWTLRPNSDGQTATITATSPLGKTTTATFQKE